MADQHHHEDSSTSNASSENSESTLELNVKTLDSQIYSFQVDKNMPVSVFKEKVASQIGLPVGQQRLIFRGKVLKDDHLLSEYHVENGHTVHLVARQPSQPQSSSSTSSGEGTANDGSRAHEPGAGGPRGRIGPISHSVVLGTLNVGDQGEGAMPDLNRVIGAVLNSIGIGSMTGGTQPGTQFTTHVPPQGNDREGPRVNGGTQTQSGNQFQHVPSFPSQPVAHVVQLPLGTAIAVPSSSPPIPDSLHTLSEFMNRMEMVMSQNGAQPNQSTGVAGNPPRVELPRNSRGLSTPESLSIVMRQAQRLISDRTTATLSHFAGRMEQEGSITDSAVRGQIQTQAMQVGLVMQHLGALFLELGRTIWTLRMGRSPAESFVNAGPAVYISPSGPNPIMVQPFPFQTNSLFGGPAAVPPNPGVFGPIGVGNVPRNVNIHIHAGASVAPVVLGAGPANGEGGTEGGRTNGTGLGVGQEGAMRAGNVVVTPVPSQHSVISVPVAVQPGSAVPQPPNPVPVPILVSGISGYNMQTQLDAQSGQPGTATNEELPITSGAGNDGNSSQPSGPSGNGDVVGNLPRSGVSEQVHSEGDNSSDVKETSIDGNLKAPSSTANSSSITSSDGPPTSSSVDIPAGSSSVPLGLGLGGLQPKRRSRQMRASTVSNQSEQPRADGHQVLQSIPSLATRMNLNTQPSGQMPSSAGIMNRVPPGQTVDSELDVASAMSQVLQSPALNGLLAGVSQQTGVGSPNMLRNMLEQLTQSPAMRNTVNQIAQQIDNQDLGSMFSLGGSQGGVDLSRMVQQMMPIVSQTLGNISSVSTPPAPSIEPCVSESGPRANMTPIHETFQFDLQQVAQSIEHQRPSGEIFQSIAERVLQSGEYEVDGETVMNELCSEEGLLSEFTEMLRHDISRRLDT